jgi:hypothetical protein
MKHQGLARGRAARRTVAKWHRAAWRVQRAYGGFRIKSKFKHAVHQVESINEEDAAAC